MTGFSGKWGMVTQSPMGAQSSTLDFQENSGVLTGISKSMLGALAVESGRVDGKRATWTVKMTQPMPLTLEADVTLDSNDTFTGGMKAGGFGTWPVSGKRSA
jgi:quinohemoprotein ethanol dehydrogenase